MLLFTPFLDAALCYVFIKRYNQAVNRLLGRVFCCRTCKMPSNDVTDPNVATISVINLHETENASTITTNSNDTEEMITTSIS